MGALRPTAKPSGARDCLAPETENRVKVLLTSDEEALIAWYEPVEAFSSKSSAAAPRFPDAAGLNLKRVLDGYVDVGAGALGRELRMGLCAGRAGRFGAAISPSRIACLRASLRLRRTASAFSRVFRSEGFS